MANLLLYNPASLQSAALLQRRPMSQAQQNEMLSKALQEQMANDPQQGQIQDWRDRSMTPFGVGAGLTGVAAQIASALVAKDKEKKLTKDYQGRQQSQTEMYARILAPNSDGASPLDSLTPAQRQMIEPYLANPDTREQASAILMKSAFDPQETPIYQTYTGSDGQQYAWNPKKPDEQPRALPNSQKPDEFDNIETVVDGRPGIYRQNKRTGEISSYVGALPPKQPATVVNNIPDNGQGAWAKEDAKLWAQRHADTVTLASKSPTQLALYDEFERLNSSADSGPIPAVSLGVRAALKDYGFDDKNVPNQEAMRSMTNQFTLGKVDELGGNQISDGDRAFLKEIPPSYFNTREGNKLIIDIGRRTEKRKMDIARLQQKYIAENGRLDSGYISYEQDWAEKNPLFDDKFRAKVAQGKGGDGNRKEYNYGPDGRRIP